MEDCMILDHKGNVTHLCPTKYEARIVAQLAANEHRYSYYILPIRYNESIGLAEEVWPENSVKCSGPYRI